MLTSKRIDGDYSIVSSSGGTITLGDTVTDPVVVAGNLTISGTLTTVDTIDLVITDNTIILNDGETGPGITHVSGTAGIEIDRGDGVSAGEIFAFIKFDEAADGGNGAWTLDQGDGVVLEITAIAGGGSPMFNLIDDTTPQVGGTGGLDMRTNSITTSDLGSDIDIEMPIGNSNDITITTLHADATIILTASGLNGEIIATSPVMLQGAAPNTTPGSGEAALFKGTDGGGGTQIHFENDTDTGELVSKTKAMVFGLIF